MVGFLLDALYNEYASTVVAAYGVCAARDYDLVCFAGGSSVCGFLAVQEDDIAPLVARQRRPVA